MNVVVIAPLVEDADTLKRLRAAGADCAQGFALGSPDDGWREHEKLALERLIPRVTPSTRFTRSNAVSRVRVSRVGDPSAKPCAQSALRRASA